MLRHPIVLDDLRADPGRVVAESASASLLDLDDGVLCLEFHSKGNTLDGDTLAVAEHAFAAIPGRRLGLVVGNQGAHFSFGANLRWLLGLLDEIGDDRAAFHKTAKRFQRVTTGMRTAPFPVVAAPFGLTIGGALEMSMYCDGVQACADMRARLPELAVGILPDLGGTSELYIRCVEAAGDAAAGLLPAFQTIAFMKESSSETQARELCFLRENDRVSAGRATLLDDAKARVLELAGGYAAPDLCKDVPVLGDAGYERCLEIVDRALASAAFTPYDAQVARAVARVMTGGRGSARTLSHAALLDLETEYFETLVFDERTRARMEHMLRTGTPLRN